MATAWRYHKHAPHILSPSEPENMGHSEAWEDFHAEESKEARELSREPGMAHFPESQVMPVMDTLSYVSTHVSILKQKIKINKKGYKNHSHLVNKTPLVCNLISHDFLSRSPQTLHTCWSLPISPAPSHPFILNAPISSHLTRFYHFAKSAPVPVRPFLVQFASGPQHPALGLRPR